MAWNNYTWIAWFYYATLSTSDSITDCSCEFAKIFRKARPENPSGCLLWLFWIFFHICHGRLKQKDSYHKNFFYTIHYSHLHFILQNVSKMIKLSCRIIMILMNSRGNIFQYNSHVFFKVNQFLSQKHATSLKIHHFWTIFEPL